MTSLVAGKVATGVDPMCTAKINYSPGFKFQNLTISSTSLFTALLNLLQNDDFATGGNRSDFIQLILSGKDKKKSSEASRSLPGPASIILGLLSLNIKVVFRTKVWTPSD